MFGHAKGGAYFTMKYTAARGIETINIFTIERQDNQMEISKNTAQGDLGQTTSIPRSLAQRNVLVLEG